MLVEDGERASRFRIIDEAVKRIIIPHHVHTGSHFAYFFLIRAVIDVMTYHIALREKKVLKQYP